MPGTRLFVAVWPPPAVVDAVAALPIDDSDAVRRTTPDQLHITLRFLGSVPQVASVVDALRTVEHAPVDIEVGPATRRLGPGVLMVPARGLDGLAAALPLPADRPFTGHLTVARARNRRQVPRALEGLPLRAAWQATSFALVRSQTKPTGAVYDDVAVFALS
jgi:2'-5' RNA ligase